MGRASKEYYATGRRYQRASAVFPAEFTWGTISDPATIMVIGLGGCFLASAIKVPLDEEVELSFRLEPGAEPIRCRGKVAWITGHGRGGVKTRNQRMSQGFAVEFLRIFPEDRARIDEFVRKQTRLFRHIEHELAKHKPDFALIKDLFSLARPGESTHLGHIKKVSREEVHNFRLRK